ncbi:coiled-coil domain-containing protein 169-like [Protopterus annectens]|uniref:coiled-coil domain-containing protein 169-like n=1 Tax=Protopterus annectens TaxID=7888 RepID=UPI001CFB0945|nr:coiled-coil domain-containing protein 169-like [Protopterus annectens]
MEADSEHGSNNVARLSLELEEEQQMKAILEVSVSQMKSTIDALEKRLSFVEHEGNEWKTRYETQQELNRQLDRQILLLEEKLDEIRGNPADRLSSIRSYDDMPVNTLKQLLKQLDLEKRSLQNELDDYEMRLEQEAKAYHKVNDERRTYLMEISQTSVTVEAAKKQAGQAHGRREKQKGGISNVPANQRILDPKKGPIKKTAAVKHLPKLNY